MAINFILHIIIEYINNLFRSLTLNTVHKWLVKIVNKICKYIFLISLLSVAGETLLDDLDLLNTLQTSKATSTSIQESLTVTEQTEEEIDLAREEYRPCSKLASILFSSWTTWALSIPCINSLLMRTTHCLYFPLTRVPKRQTYPRGSIA